MQVLCLYALPKATRKALTAAHPDWQLIDRDAYAPEMATTIDVILGWNAQAAKIVAGPNQVRFVQAMSAGVDYLPLQAFAKQGIQLANTAGIHAEPIAEYVLGGLLSVARGLTPPAQDWDTRTRFKQMWTLREKQAVVFGTGHIGQAVAKHLREFGAHVQGVSHSGAAKPHFESVGTQQAMQAQIATAAILVNTMPLTAATTHYFNTAFFAPLTGQPVFVNVGRGASVDTQALIEALDAGKVRHAVLDVFEEEPLSADSALWHRADVLLTPHVSGQTEHLREQVAAIFVPNLESLANTGKLATHIVDLSSGY